MKILHLLRNAAFLVFGKKTIGARILLVKDNHVLLVKHTYIEGWYTIGGGVDAKETPRQAIERELQEEAGVSLLSPPELFGVYYNAREKCDDYIIFYVGNDCVQHPVESPEIAEQRWFPLNQLPDDVTPATRRRIDEYLGLSKVTEFW